MDSSDYEYRGLIAASWDLLRGDTSNWDDRFFYKKVIEESGQPALDIGCGTGRLLLDYLSQGVTRRHRSAVKPGKNPPHSQVK